MARSPAAALSLGAGSLRLALRPDLGACIAGLWLGDVPVLMSAEPATMVTARPSGGFALVPYSNRIGFLRFHWQGAEYTTEANSGASPHSMHGVAWHQAWEVTASTADSAELRYRHAADGGWPFPFEVIQQVKVRPDSLELRLHFTNTHSQDQPVGLGWHPYFVKRARSRLQLAVASRWESDAQGLPTQRVGHTDIAEEVARLDLDHCFEGWSGEARLEDEALRVTLRSSLPRVVVYTPRDKDFYCVEPVSHVNNAIRMTDPLAHGLRQLAPGDTLEAWMTIAVETA